MISKETLSQRSLESDHLPVPTGEAPIIWNPFIGLSSDDASDLCYEIMETLTHTLPKRPASPSERDEYGCTYFLTDRGNAIYEAVEESAKRALVEAGHSKTCFSGPIQEI